MADSELQHHIGPMTTLCARSGDQLRFGRPQRRGVHPRPTTSHHWSRSEGDKRLTRTLSSRYRWGGMVESLSVGRPWFASPISSVYTESVHRCPGKGRPWEARRAGSCSAASMIPVETGCRDSLANIVSANSRMNACALLLDCSFLGRARDRQPGLLGFPISVDLW